MSRLAWNTPLKLIALGYAAVLVIATVLVIGRYAQYALHPDDVAAYGGMWAGGDLMLELFIVGMLLFVTFFLVLVTRKSESSYTRYAKALVGISLTAPMSVVVIGIQSRSGGNSTAGWIFGYACMFRLFASPLVALGMGGSRLLARFPRAQRLTVYALLIEGGTLAAIAVLLFSLH